MKRGTRHRSRLRLDHQDQNSYMTNEDFASTVCKISVVGLEMMEGWGSEQYLKHCLNCLQHE